MNSLAVLVAFKLSMNVDLKGRCDDHGNSQSIGYKADFTCSWPGCQRHRDVHHCLDVMRLWEHIKGRDCGEMVAAGD